MRERMTKAALRKKLGEKRGMTLVEMLVAMAVLVIAIMCFLPLAQTTFRNLFTVGERTSSNYKSVGLLERLIGNSGANGDYEVSTEDVPLQMTVKTQSIVSNSSSLQSIDGASLLANPAIGGNSLSTFVCDSVTAKMVCYPSHIADDFLTKTITLYASGFRFSSINEFKIYYTDSSGNRQIIGGVYNDSNPYCQIEISGNLNIFGKTCRFVNSYFDDYGFRFRRKCSGSYRNCSRQFTCRNSYRVVFK